MSCNCYSCTTVCKPYNPCKPCNPCNPCNQYTLCAPYWQNCCPTPCPTIVAYITTPTAPIAVPSGGARIPSGTIIATGSTAVPVNTVTVINSLSAAPSTNIGGVTMNNGFFTAPVAGRYSITGNICFDSVSTVAAGEYRELLIYSVAATTGEVKLAAVANTVPIAGNDICLNVSTAIDLAINDRVFIAVRQLNTLAAAINTGVDPGRFAMVRIN